MKPRFKMKKEKKLVPNFRFPEFEGEWEKKSIKKVLTIGSGKDHKHLEDGDVPVYGSGGVMRYVNDFLYDGESIGIGRKGTIDKPVFLDGKFWTVDTLFFTHSFVDSYPKFIFSQFQRINWLRYNEASGVPSLSKKTIEKINIYLPELEEQQKIANFLTAVDTRLQSLEKKKNLLEAYKKGVMQKIFKQEIRFKDEDGKGFPDWESKKFSEFLSIPEKVFVENIDKTKILTVRLHLKGVFKNDRTESLKIGATKYIKRKKGQFIYGKQNLFNGAFGIIPEELDGYISSADIPTLDIDTEIINKYYFYYYLSRESYYRRLENISSGSGSKRIHEKTLLNLKLKLPCIKEQTKIASFLSAIDHKIVLASEQIEKTEVYKKGLLQQMFV